MNDGKSKDGWLVAMRKDPPKPPMIPDPGGEPDGAENVRLGLGFWCGNGSRLPQIDRLVRKRDRASYNIYIAFPRLSEPWISTLREATSSL